MPGQTLREHTYPVGFYILLKDQVSLKYLTKKPTCALKCHKA